MKPVYPLTTTVGCLFLYFMTGKFTLFGIALIAAMMFGVAKAQEHVAQGRFD